MSLPGLTASPSVNSIRSARGVETRLDAAVRASNQARRAKPATNAAEHAANVTRLALTGPLARHPTTFSTKDVVAAGTQRANRGSDRIRMEALIKAVSDPKQVVLFTDSEEDQALMKKVQALAFTAQRR